jgi:hypothetical protein
LVCTLEIVKAIQVASTSIFHGRFSLLQAAGLVLSAACSLS